MRKLLTVVLFLMSGVALAAGYSSAPANCLVKNFKFQQQLVNLNTSGKNVPMLFLLRNNSSQNLTLNHPTNKSASAGWSSNLNSGSWSAIFIRQGNFALGCYAPNDITKSVPCIKSLQICEVKNPQFKGGIALWSGNFWVAENKAALEDLLKAIQKRGVQF